MDLENLGLFFLMAGIALSILSLAVGFTVRIFLGPILRDFLNQWGAGRSDRLGGVLGRIEERLDSLEAGLERVSAAQEFDKRLGPRLEGERKTE